MSKKQTIYHQPTHGSGLNGAVGRRAKIIASALAIVFVCGLAYSMVSSTVSGTDTLELQYRHGIVARITYDYGIGIPAVDSTSTAAQIRVQECVIDVVWDIPATDEALQYFDYQIQEGLLAHRE